MNLLIDKHGLTLHLSLWFLIVLCFILVFYFSELFRNNRLRVEKVDFNLPGMGTITVSQNKDTVQLAHKAWAELATRKAFLPFDETNDVIVEVYDSWYQLFRALREIVKEVPTSMSFHQQSDESRLIQAIVGALNFGLRPHLTKWQAKFRRWYSQAILLEENLNKSPQEIQREFPYYLELISDLRESSKELSVYTQSMQTIALSHRKKRWRNKNEKPST